MHTGRIYDPDQRNTFEGPVIYWMSRDQRVEDNWALIYALESARQLQCGIAVVFTLVPRFEPATLRQYDFMLRGLEEVEVRLNALGIPFYLLTGEPVEALVPFLRNHGIRTVVTDFDPLRIKRQWKKELSEKLPVHLVEVDAHNIIPCRIASQKAEFGAYTFRPRINRLLPEYLDEFPGIESYAETVISLSQSPVGIRWDRLRDFLRVDRQVGPVDWIQPGYRQGMKRLSQFIRDSLSSYAGKRNDPNARNLSGLSPYLHFGQIAPQRVATEIIRNVPSDENTAAFLEELITRRELSDNFCFYQPRYDQVESFPAWARETHRIHRKDEREYLYSPEQFEQAATHDPLWNAAQREMVQTGKMHGYLRMYWAKKILEWTEGPEEALHTAIWLNDRYELDGRDPNGYAGCAWSIGGIHDRAWAERPVFGKIRYMNYNGCRRKFDVDQYIESINNL